jgi:hypothetical protein
VVGELEKDEMKEWKTAECREGLARVVHRPFARGKLENPFGTSWSWQTSCDHLGSPTAQRRPRELKGLTQLAG